MISLYVSSGFIVVTIIFLIFNEKNKTTTLIQLHKYLIEQIFKMIV